MIKVLLILEKIKMNNSKLYLPFELIVIIAEIGGPDIWRLLAISIPEFGIYSLKKNVQKIMKDKWTVRKVCDDGITIYTLPDGTLHRSWKEGPAYTKEIGQIYTRYWYESGIHHRGDDEPSVIEICHPPERRTHKSVYIWMKNGIIHRDEGPALIKKQQGTESKRWFKNGELHRKNKPAVITSSRNFVIGEQWYNNGKRHREDGPAIINYFSTDDVKNESWFKHGNSYCTENKPHHIRYINKKIVREMWLNFGEWDRIEIYYENGCKREERKGKKGNRLHQYIHYGGDKGKEIVIHKSYGDRLRFGLVPNLNIISFQIL